MFVVNITLTYLHLPVLCYYTLDGVVRRHHITSFTYCLIINSWLFCNQSKWLILDILTTVCCAGYRGVCLCLCVVLMVSLSLSHYICINIRFCACLCVCVFAISVCSSIQPSYQPVNQPDFYLCMYQSGSLSVMMHVCYIYLSVCIFVCLYIYLCISIYLLLYLYNTIYCNMYHYY